jgi:hypothetical protein
VPEAPPATQQVSVLDRTAVLAKAGAAARAGLAGAAAEAVRGKLDLGAALARATARRALGRSARMAQAATEAAAKVSLQLLLERWGSCECPTTGGSTYSVPAARDEQSCGDDDRALMQQQTNCCMSRVRVCLRVSAV